MVPRPGVEPGPPALQTSARHHESFRGKGWAWRPTTMISYLVFKDLGDRRRHRGSPGNRTPLARLRVGGFAAKLGTRRVPSIGLEPIQPGLKDRCPSSRAPTAHTAEPRLFSFLLRLHRLSSSWAVVESNHASLMTSALQAPLLPRARPGTRKSRLGISPGRPWRENFRLVARQPPSRFSLVPSHELGPWAGFVKTGRNEYAPPPTWV